MPAREKRRQSGGSAAELQESPTREFHDVAPSSRQHVRLQSTLILASLMIGHHFVGFGLLKSAERLRRLHARAARPAGQAWRAGRCTSGSAKAVDGRGIELGDDVLRRVFRRPQSEPDRGIEARQAGFVGGRHVGQARHARLGRNGQRVDACRPAPARRNSTTARSSYRSGRPSDPAPPGRRRDTARTGSVVPVDFLK